MLDKLYSPEDIDLLREEFHALRTEFNLSQAWVAAVLKLSQGNISQFETQPYQQPRRATVEKIRKLVEIWRLEKPNIVMLRQSDSSSTQYKCPKCGREVVSPDDGAKYCLSCGFAFRIKCRCGHENEGGAKFCSACGKPMLSNEELDAFDFASATTSDVKRWLAGMFSRWLEETGLPDRIGPKKG
jgi:endogenous inhibitor of DNA gyrase (YacG/DUF329 family)